MAERGETFGMDVEHDWFAAVVINFRKDGRAGRAGLEGDPFFLPERFLDSLGESGDHGVYPDPVKEGISPWQRRDGGQGQDGPCGSVYGGEDPGTLGCRGGPDRLCGRIGPERFLQDPGYSDAFQAIRVQKDLAGDECLRMKSPGILALQEFLSPERENI